MAGWLSGTGLAITGKLEKQGKLCPFVMGNVHFRLAGGLSPLSAGHDSRVGHDTSMREKRRRRMKARGMRP